MDIESICNSIINSIKKFDPNTMDYLMWLNTFEYTAEVAQVKKEDLGLVLLQMLEPHAVTLITESLHLSSTYEPSYEELNCTLETLYGKFQGEIAMIYRFHLRCQFPYESARHYFQVLTILLSSCPPDIHSKENLRKRFIDGLANEETKAMLRENHKDVPLPSLLKIAKLRESINNEILIPHLE